MSVFRSPRIPVVYQLAMITLSILALGPGGTAAEVPEPAKKDSPKAAAEKKSEIPSDEQLRKRLTEIQYAVTRQNATERPFTNEFWRHKAEGERCLSVSI